MKLEGDREPVETPSSTSPVYSTPYNYPTPSVPLTKPPAHSSPPARSRTRASSLHNVAFTVHKVRDSVIEEIEEPIYEHSVIDSPKRRRSRAKKDKS